MATKHPRRLNKLTVYKYDLGCDHRKRVIFLFLLSQFRMKHFEYVHMQLAGN
jgi:hypothetical protein